MKAKISFVIGIMLISLLTCLISVPSVDAYISPYSSSWVQWGGANKLGVDPNYLLPGEEPNEIWSTTITGKTFTYSSVFTDNGSNLFVTSDDGIVYSFNSTDGSLNWLHSVTGTLEPTSYHTGVYHSGYVWVTSDSHLCKLNALTGASEANYTTPGTGHYHTHLVLVDGLIIGIGDGGPSAFEIDTSSWKWHLHSGGTLYDLVTTFYHSPGGTGYNYLLWNSKGSTYSQYFCANISSGTAMWNTQSWGNLMGGCPVFGDGYIYGISNSNSTMIKFYWNNGTIPKTLSGNSFILPVDAQNQGYMSWLGALDHRIIFSGQASNLSGYYNYVFSYQSNFVLDWRYNIGAGVSNYYTGMVSANYLYNQFIIQPGFTTKFGQGILSFNVFSRDGAGTNTPWLSWVIEAPYTERACVCILGNGTLVTIGSEKIILWSGSITGYVPILRLIEQGTVDSPYFTLGWTGPTNASRELIGFKLYRGYDNMTFFQITTLDNATFSYTDSSVVPYTIYYYEIRGYTILGDGYLSNVLQVEIGPPIHEILTGEPGIISDMIPLFGLFFFGLFASLIYTRKFSLPMFLVFIGMGLGVLVWLGAVPIYGLAFTGLLYVSVVYMGRTQGGGEVE